MLLSIKAKKICAVAGGAVALLGASLGGATPADAATTMGCPSKNVCVYQHNSRLGTVQIISGFNNYTNLNKYLHDQASSWTNANDYTAEAIGEWRNGAERIGQVLPAGWYEDSLGSVGFDNVADYVKRV